MQESACLPYALLQRPRSHHHSAHAHPDLPIGCAVVDAASRRPATARHSPLGDIHLKDIWAIIVRHWMLIVAMVIVVAGGAWYTGRDTIPQYRSSLTLQVSSSKTAFGRTDDIDVDPLALQTDPVLSEALVLTTQALAREVVYELSLQLELVDPTIARGSVFTAVEVDQTATFADYTVVRSPPPAGWDIIDAAGSTIVSGAYGARARGPGFAADVLPPEGGAETNAFRIVHPDQAAAAVRAGLGYQVRAATSAFDVSYTGSDPSLVPLVLNEAAVQLQRDGVDRLTQAISRRTRFIEGAIDSTERELGAVLDTIEAFKATHQVTNLTAEQQTLVVKISDFDRDLIAARIRVSTLESAIEEARLGDIDGLNRLAAAEAVQTNQALTFQINRLLSLYEDRRKLMAGTQGLREDNPQIQALESEISDGHAALVRAASATLVSVRQQEAAVAERISELRSELNRYLATENEMARIEISASTLRETARWLQSQYQLVQIQNASLGPYVAVLDGATPPARIGTSPRQKMFLGILVGLLIGIAGAFFLEYLDQTIKTSADVERVLRVPVLGQIPAEARMAASRHGGRAVVVTTNELMPDAPASEAYRALRTNVTFVGAERPLQLIVVTSPGPGEGKTTTAANLALSLGAAGSRTILLDGDMRRPEQHRAFRIVQSPGLTDVLVGEAQLAEVIRPNLADNLDLIPAGKIPPNPSELLGSDGMRQVIDSLRNDYEYIVIDTPPVLPVTDAVVAAASSDAVVVVLRSGSTEEVAALRAFEQLDKVKARVAGVVLNGLSARLDQHYAYYSYGGYSERAPRARKARRGS